MGIIDDGTGSGYAAKVDSNKRLHTQSVSETEAEHAAEVGEAFNINTGLISYSAAGTMLYFKNNENNDFIVEAIAVGIGSTGTHSDVIEITIEKNITGGDLISDATAVAMNQNRNFASSTAVTADVFAGKSGGTSTGGTDAALFIQSAGGRLFGNVGLVLPKGSNIAITVDPNLSSGSVNMYAAIIGFIKDSASSDV